jgi:hypothetical protein
VTSDARSESRASIWRGLFIRFINSLRASVYQARSSSMRTAADLVSNSESGNPRKGQGRRQSRRYLVLRRSGGIFRDAKLVAAPSTR